MELKKIIEKAEAERAGLMLDVDALLLQIGTLKQERAALLFENGLDGNARDVQQINEQLHNARRTLNAWTRRREDLSFLVEYIRANVAMQISANNPPKKFKIVKR